MADEKCFVATILEGCNMLGHINIIKVDHST